MVILSIRALLISVIAYQKRFFFLVIIICVLKISQLFSNFPRVRHWHFRAPNKSPFTSAQLLPCEHVRYITMGLTHLLLFSRRVHAVLCFIDQDDEYRTRARHCTVFYCVSALRPRPGYGLQKPQFRRLLSARRLYRVVKSRSTRISLDGLFCTCRAGAGLFHPA